MGIIKSEDIIAWRDEDGRILCHKCANVNKDTPLTEDDIDDDDIVICDESGERIR